jgi:ligand-binding SRPBCC domain-containing protein
VFAFFGDARNLERITPPELRFRITSPIPAEMQSGVLLDYRLALFGVPIQWRTLISVWRPGEYFVDEQLEGPYRMWVHHHRFSAEAGGTRVRDEVHYRLPLAPAGWLVAPVVALQLGRIFDFRTRAVTASLAPAA